MLMQTSSPEEKEEHDDILAHHNLQKNSEGLSPTIYEVESCPDTADGVYRAVDCVMETLKAHVNKYGSVDEIILSGHGNPAAVKSRSSPRDPIKGWPREEHIFLSEMLEGLESLQKETGKQITDELVLDACNTFSMHPMLVGFREEDVVKFRDAAKRLKMDISGSIALLSTYVIDGPMLSVSDAWGNFIKITRDGEVVRDQERTRWGPLPALRDWMKNWDAGYDNSWVDCHLNKTQEEGEACMQKISKARNRDKGRD